MNSKIKKASIINIIINVFLMFLNLIVGIIFSSVSFISKGLESFQDILTGIIIYFTIKINNKERDDNHQFGHSRAENLAAYTIGIIMTFLGFEVINYGYNHFINPQIIQFNNLLFYVVLIALISKSFLYFYIKNILKTNSSPALKANMEDHFNDILMYLALFIGVISIKYGYFYVDSIIAILIGLYIIYSGISIVIENTHFLMGKNLEEDKIKKIKKIALSFSDVLKVDLLRTQYLGNKIQVEIHIAINSKTDLKKAHDLGNLVREKIKKDSQIISCFVHINPV